MLIAVEIPVMTKPGKELQAKVTKTKRTTKKVAKERRWLVKRRPAVNSEREEETDGETEGEPEAETEEELPKPKKVGRPRGSTNKNSAIINKEPRTAIIPKPKKRVAFQPIDLTSPTSFRSNGGSLDSPALQILRNLGHPVRAGAPSPMTPVFSQRNDFNETLSSMTNSLTSPSTIQTQPKQQKGRVLCPPEDLLIYKPKTKVKFDLSVPVKNKPRTEEEAKINKSTKPNKELQAKTSKATKNLMKNLTLSKKALGGANPLGAPPGNSRGVKNPRDDVCDVSPTSACELAEQFVQDLDLSPSWSMVENSTPGFMRGREERLMLARPGHWGGVRKPDDHVESPVSPLAPALKFLHNLDLRPSLPMAPHNTPQMRNDMEGMGGEDCIDLITPIEAGRPAIEELRDLQDDQDRRPEYSEPPPSPTLTDTAAEAELDHEREAALSLLTRLRDLDDAFGEAKAICNFLVPVYPEMERPLEMPREVKCGIRGLERRIRKCREFYLGELVGIVERAAGPAGVENDERRTQRRNRHVSGGRRSRGYGYCEVRKEV